jgi:hypothetical protein
MPRASTPDPLPFFNVPLPIEIDPLRDAPLPPFSMLIIDLARLTVLYPLLVVEGSTLYTERVVAKSWGFDSQ